MKIMKEIIYRALFTPNNLTDRVVCSCPGCGARVRLKMVFVEDPSHEPFVHVENPFAPYVWVISCGACGFKKAGRFNWHDRLITDLGIIFKAFEYIWFCRNVGSDCDNYSCRILA